jgi:hypothetical protein
VLSAALKAPREVHPIFTLSGGGHTDTFTRYQCCALHTLSVWSHTPAFADIPGCILPLRNGQMQSKMLVGVLARLV